MERPNQILWTDFHFDEDRYAERLRFSGCCSSSNALKTCHYHRIWLEHWHFDPIDPSRHAFGRSTAGLLTSCTNAAAWILCQYQYRTLCEDGIFQMCIRKDVIYSLSNSSISYHHIMCFPLSDQFDAVPSVISPLAERELLTTQPARSRRDGAAWWFSSCTLTVISCTTSRSQSFALQRRIL